MNTQNDALSKSEFDGLSTLIYQESGINLIPEKQTMTETRLRRRLTKLDISSFAEYCSYVSTPKGNKAELVHLIDAITTNKTDFFREADHFDYLVSHALPDLAKRNPTQRNCLVWSAGCSSGEEPYTLAMVLREYEEQWPGFQFSILATDICTTVLEKATLGIFKSDVLGPISPNLQRKYLMRSRNRESDLFRVVPELRARITFRRLNFMDPEFGLNEKPGIIFCRNVIIYFDKPTQLRLLKRLADQLAPGGYFFSGHSESLQGMDLPLVPVAPAVYWKRQ